MCRHLAKAMEYCEKDGDTAEGGHMASKPTGKPGKRSDLEALVELAKGRKRLREAIDGGAISSFQQLKFFEKLREVYDKAERRDGMRVLWLYGPTGVGKSHHAFDFVSEADCATKHDHDKYFSYDGETHMVWDELSGLKDGSLASWLGIAGGQPYMMRVMHGRKACHVKYLIMTSHHHPHYLLEDKARWPEVARRLTAGLVQCAPDTDWEALRAQFYGDQDHSPPLHAPPVDPFQATSGDAPAYLP